MITRIKAISKDEMRSLRSQRKFDKDGVAAISVTDPDAASVFSEDKHNIVAVKFNDVTPMAWYGATAAVDDMKFMSTYDARRIVYFIDRLKSRPEPIELWVNCSAGINRSGSIARYAFKHSDGLTHDQFLADNPQIKGNDWVLMKLLEAEFEVFSE